MEDTNSRVNNSFEPIDYKIFALSDVCPEILVKDEVHFEREASEHKEQNGCAYDMPSALFSTGAELKNRVNGPVSNERLGNDFSLHLKESQSHADNRALAGVLHDHAPMYTPNAKTSNSGVKLEAQHNDSMKKNFKHTLNPETPQESCPIVKLKNIFSIASERHPRIFVEVKDQETYPKNYVSVKNLNLGTSKSHLDIIGKMKSQASHADIVAKMEVEKIDVNDESSLSDLETPLKYSEFAAQLDLSERERVSSRISETSINFFNNVTFETSEIATHASVKEEEDLFEEEFISVGVEAPPLNMGQQPEQPRPQLNCLERQIIIANMPSEEEQSIELLNTSTHNDAQMSDEEPTTPTHGQDLATDKRPFGCNLRKCEICNQLYTSRSSLEAHISTVHLSESNTSECRVSTSVGMCRQKEVPVNVNKNKLAYGLIDKTLSSEPAHQAQKCLFCKERFKNTWSLMVHLRKDHPMVKVLFKCIHCSRLLPVRCDGYYFRYHETGRCAASPAGAFSAPSAPQQHESTHLDVSALKCTTCEEVFSTSAELQVHKGEHVHYAGPLNNGDSAPTKRFNRSIDAQCESLSYVTNVQASDLVRKEPVVFRCPLCLESFVTTSPLKLHLKQHLYECNFCEQSCCRLTILAHLITHTEIPKCPTCSKTFESHISLNDHVRTHWQPRIKCTFCEKSHRSVCAILSHLYNKHLDPESFECSSCAKTFHSRYELGRHSRRHLGVKPFRCGLCEKTFVELHELREHVRQRVKGDPGTIYECDYCDGCFSDPSELRLHVNEHRKNKIFNCSQCGATFDNDKAVTEHKKSHGLRLQPYKLDGHGPPRESRSATGDLKQSSTSRSTRGLPYSKADPPTGIRSKIKVKTPEMINAMALTHSWNGTVPF